MSIQQFKLPTAQELEASAPPGFQQWAGGKTRFSWEALATFAACRSVGISIVQSAAAAGISRDCWYEWRKEEFGWFFDELAAKWIATGATAMAARVAALAGNADPNIAGTNARWMAERMSEAHAPPPKREIVQTQVDHGTPTIVIEGMDGIVQPPDVEPSDAE